MSSLLERLEAELDGGPRAGQIFRGEDLPEAIDRGVLGRLAELETRARAPRLFLLPRPPERPLGWRFLEVILPLAGGMAAAAVFFLLLSSLGVVRVATSYAAPRVSLLTAGVEDQIAYRLITGVEACAETIPRAARQVRIELRFLDSPGGRSRTLEAPGASAELDRCLSARLLELPLGADPLVLELAAAE